MTAGRQRVEMTVQGVEHAGRAGQRGRQVQGVVAQATEGERSDQAADEETGDDQGAQRQTLPRQGASPQDMAQADAQVGDHAAEVGGTDDRAAVSAGHGVLQPAGHRSEQRAEDLLAMKQRRRREQQYRLDRQGHAVTASQAQGAVLHDHAAQRGAGEEGEDHAQQVHRRAKIGTGQRRGEQRSRAGQVGDRLMLEAQIADHVDHAGDAGQGAGPQPYPAWQML